MDKQFDKLNSWLLFELIVTVSTLLLVFFLGMNNKPPGDMVYAWLGGMFFLILRIFFLGSAWWSLYDGAWKGDNYKNIPGSSKD